MKKLLMFICLLVTGVALAQVGIGTTDPKSTLDIPATNPATPAATDGILIPRVSAFPATNPTVDQNGMMVFLTTVSGTNQPGFYYWDNPTTSWKGIGANNAGWNLIGNSGTNPAVNFIGTIDNNDLVFKRNSVPAGRIGVGSIAFGTNALALNTTALNNVAIGSDALGAQNFSNAGLPYMTDNVAIGNGALRSNNPTTTLNGSQNVALGTSSLFSNTTGDRNVAIGTESLRDNTTGSGNMGIGYAALRNNETGEANVAVGVGALMNNTLGSDNIAIGKSALIANTIGEMNGAFSSQALANNTTGSYNLAQGFSALMFNTSGNSNTAIGVQALQDNPDGSNNVGIGAAAMAILTNGSTNTAIGSNAMRFQTAGSSNIAIGNSAALPSLTGSNQLSIGNLIYGTGINSGTTSRIGINEPAPNAKLQINASSVSSPNNTDGIIIPRINVFPSVNPAAAQNGMMVFLTTASGSNQPGFYYWDHPSNSWKGVGSNTANAWNLTGNTGYNAATSFIGSIDSKEVFFRHTNQPSGVIGAASTAFGYRSGGTYNIAAKNTSIGSLAAESNTVGLDNTTIGSEALNRNTAGGKNVAIGNRALYTQAFSNGGTAFDTDNVAIGYEALFTTNQTMLDEGNRNVAIGNYASRSNTTGNDNTSIGYRALYSNINGFHSVAIGTQALENATGYGNNLAIGWRAMQNNTGGDNMAFGAAALQGSGSGVGHRNTAIGMQAMVSNDTGSNNIAIGYASLLNNRTGNGNTVMGDMALTHSQTGSYATAIGYQALLFANNTTTPFVNTNTAIGTEAIMGNADPSINTGLANTATGYQALTGNSSGSSNTVNGKEAMESNTTGSSNTAVGNQTMQSNITGSNNTAVGNQALHDNSVGAGNVALGYQAGYSETGSNKLYIDNSNTATPLIYGDFATNRIRINGYEEVINTQLTANGDGQNTLYSLRTRDSQNDGTGYSIGATNNAIAARNLYGDLYTFGVAGYSDNDFNRSGGVFGGCFFNNTHWASLGYKNSGNSPYGVYAVGTFLYNSSGTGRTANSGFENGIGGGFYGGVIGTWSKGNIGSISSGNFIAAYNSGDEYTHGRQVEVVNTTNGKKTAFTMTSTQAVVYQKGKITLINGTAHVSFDSDYADLLGDVPVVTTTPMGECNGVYIASADKTGFTVKELGNGTSNATVSWIAVGDRVDANQSVAREVVAGDFDDNINEVMFNENNKNQSAKGVWSELGQIRFGNLTRTQSQDDKEEAKQ